MKFWPWSRFTKYEQELETLYRKRDELEYLELDLRDAIKDLELRLDASMLARNELTERCIHQANRLLQTEADYNLIRTRFQRLEAEMNNKARSSIVLNPPTQHAVRHHKKDPGDHENVLGSHEPLEGLYTSPWPFPTADMYDGGI
jgi:hypothetical protein